MVLVTTSLGPYLSRPYEKLMDYKYFILRELEQGHAVIFRPHPLLYTTIKSMRPDTMDTYKSLIDNLYRQQHCIVDQSEYLERAIGIADRLISDPSSVVEVWKATGKPYKVI